MSTPYPVRLAGEELWLLPEKAVYWPAQEALLMGLRLREGIDLADIARRTGVSVDALIDALHVIPVILHDPVERDVFAGVVHFLPGEGLDLCCEFRRQIVAEPLQGIDEEGFTARQAGRDRIVPGGSDRIV